MAPELEYPGEMKRGSVGPSAKKVQEWLSLHGFHLKIDSDFGAATESAVRQFQGAQGLQVDGVVGPATFDRLTSPMRSALAPIAVNGRTLGGMVAAWARQQLASVPREVGGPNRGPWVRLYMKGHDGEEFLWCAGFACFCLEKAVESLGVAPPIKSSDSCDELAGAARTAGILLENPAPADRGRITAGSLFLVRKTPTDWVHTGIVVEPGPEAFQTIEGNTNDDGSSNGDGAYKRTRAFGRGNIDFVLIP
jgi:hypothetical protein